MSATEPTRTAADAWNEWSKWAAGIQKRADTQAATNRKIDTAFGIIIDRIERIEAGLTALRERSYQPGPADPWLSRFRYNASEIVSHRGKNYIGRRSSQGAPPDGSSGDWERLAAMDDSASGAGEAVAQPPLRVVGP
jgi:hypothetical protein